MANQYGFCYNPTWSGWEPGSPGQLSDSDFFNDSFQALWNDGTDTNGNSYRNDLGTIQGAGSTLIRLYNWDPTRGWNGTVGTEHIHFLNKANSLGLQVVVPVSNYFLSDDQYAWNGQALTDYSFDSAPQAIQTALTNFLGSVTQSGALHPAVHSFAVGNEIDINNFVGQGSSGAVDPATRLSRVIWWIVNLFGQINSSSLGSTLCTSPVSNADQGNPGSTPFSYWFGCFVDGVTAGVTPLPQGTAPGTTTASTFADSWAGLSAQSTFWSSNSYYNSVNIYQTGGGLARDAGAVRQLEHQFRKQFELARAAVHRAPLSDGNRRRARGAYECVNLEHPTLGDFPGNRYDHRQLLANEFGELAGGLLHLRVQRRGLFERQLGSLVSRDGFQR